MPKSVKVSAKLPKKEGVAGREDDKLATIVLDCFGENLDEDRQLSGDDVIKSNFEANVIITVQGGIRRMLEKGSDADAIQETYKSFKPGQAVRRGVDVVGGYMAWFKTLTPEQQKEEIAKLKQG